jgi:hypothetical protein
MLGAQIVPPQMSKDSELERLKMELESQRLRLEQQQAQMEADRREREQRNHELMLKLLESRNDAGGPSLTELVGSVEALRNLAGNGSGLIGLNEALEIADRINALRGDGKEDDSWLAMLKPLVPGLAQVLLTNRTGAPSTGGVLDQMQVAGAGIPEMTKPQLEPLQSAPTAYDVLAAQVRSLFERIQSQAAMGLDPVLALDGLLELAETANDPVARLVLNSFDRSLTVDAWMTWLRSQLGPTVSIEQLTLVFLSNLFAAAKALPPEDNLPPLSTN